MSAVGEAARPTRLGRYELITRIGQGGMAEVQLALQRGPAGFEKLVVVKLVHGNLASQKAFVDMLLDEARVAALVKHPNVVDIYDLGQAEGRFFIAMEYLEGEPLLAVLRAGREGKRLDPLSTGRLIADTAEGLDAAHELRSMSGERLELVHHDISLGNIVVLYNGQVKLVDFGVAKATQTAAGPKSKVQGKFSYMAPEKLKGAQGDRRSDIFSLGCVMWEALTLKRLFRGGNDTETMKQVLELPIQPPSKVNGDVPPELDAIVMRALERDPDKRHGTAKELAVEVEEVLRKRGYGAKNDKIAKYMQETFKGHIEARKKLVQEVVSKGSASAEVLDAAFSDQALASGSPVTPAPTGFSGSHRRLSPASGVPAVSNAWADSSRPTEISAPPVFDKELGSHNVPAAGKPALPPPSKSSGLRAKAGSIAPPLPKPAARSSTETDVDAEPILDNLSKGDRATTADIEPEGLAGDTTIAADPMHVLDTDAPLTPVPPMKTGIAGLLADKNKRKLVIGGAAGLFLLIIIIAVASGGDDKKEAVASVGSGSSEPLATGSDSESGSAEPVEVGSAASIGSAEEPVNAGSGSAEEPVIEIEPDAGSADAGSGSAKKDPPKDTKDTKDNKDTTDPKDTKDNKDTHRPPPPAINVEKTVNEGLMAFVKGDTKDALALLQKARAAKPGYAPTYRVLGRVYKKLGDNGNAKKSFERYLKLSPTASDAEQIKEEIKKL